VIEGQLRSHTLQQLDCRVSTPSPQLLQLLPTSARKMENPRVAFVGGGQMATALARGLITSGFTDPENIIASDVMEASRKNFVQQTGGKAKTVESNEEAVQKADIVILAVKPQVMHEVMPELRPILTTEHLIISIAAGVTMAQLVEAMGEHLRIVRVMPNTPALVGKAASAFALGGKASREDAKIVDKLLSAIGFATEVPDKLLDAVTGLSGSGPAFVYLFIEALGDGGVRSGLPRDVANKLAAQTVLGAAQMVIETGENPAVLKDRVTSPGGTTIAGVHALEKGGLRAAVIDAVYAATQRSAELGKEK
jgi:pyrroline-5-carboxylate reductase